MPRHANTLELKLVRRADGIEIDLLPLQGLWTEEQYIELTNQSNHLIEFVDGSIEVLPMPTSGHQSMLLLLYEHFKAAIRQLGGRVLVAPLRLQVRPGAFREPDILMLLDASDPRFQDQYWRGADLVVEVVSPDRPERDTVDKVRDYALAGIPEYWIVNPLDERITVLTLDGPAYRTFGQFGRGEQARSALLEGFAVGVDAVLEAG